MDKNMTTEESVSTTGTSIYFDIRNGDVAVYYDTNNKFDGADVIRFGEWDYYSKTEENEFLWLMNELKINVEEEKERYLEKIKKLKESKK